MAAAPPPDDADLASLRERLRRSEAEFRRLLDHVPDGIVVMRDSAFVYANPAAARILGYDTPEELVGVHFSAIVRPEELPRSVERVRQMGGEAPPPRNERPMVRRDGSTIYAETFGFQTVFEGQPATLVIAHDVSFEREVQAQVRQGDRLASLGLLAAGVAHELNNPLAYVLLNLVKVRSSLMGVIGGAPASVLTETEKLVEQSLEGAERMRSIVGDLRAFSRSDDRRSVLLDVRQVIDSVVGMAEHQLRAHAKLIRSYEEVPMVRANEARLGQVFINLLVNAGHAIAEAKAGSHEIHVTVRATPAREVVVEVKDSGIGMTPEVLARVFEPFFTTKGADTGTGLGLSVCLGIVQGLGGTMAAESEPGQGAAFTVTLPAAPTDDIGDDLSLPPSPTQHARVLVVDDEPRIARGLADTLAGHDVVVVTGGREAIARLREERFDVVFCDLMMPELSGVEVFEEISKRDAALASRFIFMTAGAFTPQARALLDHVPNPRLDKPFDASQVLHLFHLVLSRADES